MGVFITSMLVYVFIGAKFLRLNAEDSLPSNIEQVGNINGKSVINSPTSKSQDGFYIKVNRTSFFSKIQTLILSATHESVIRLPSAMPCIKEPERNQLKIVNVVSSRKCLCKHYKATPDKKNISINNSSKGSDILSTSCNTSAPLVVMPVKNVVTFMSVFKVAIPSNPQNSYERFKIKHTVKPNHINLNSNGIIVENQTTSNIYAAETVSFIEKNHSSGKHNSTLSISLFHSTSYPTTNNSSQKGGFSKPIPQNDISITQTNSFVGKNNSDVFTSQFATTTSTPTNNNSLAKGDGTFSISQSGSTSNPRTDNSSRKGFSKPTSQVDIYVTQTDGFPRKNNSVSTLHLPTMFSLQKNMPLEKNISIMGEQYSQNTSYVVVKIKHTVLRNHTNFDSNGIIVENQNNSNALIAENQINSNLYTTEAVGFIEESDKVSISVTKFSPENVNSLGKYNSTLSTSQSHSTPNLRTNHPSRKGNFSKSTPQIDISTTQTNSVVAKNSSNVFTLQFGTNYTSINRNSLRKYDSTAFLSLSHSTSSSQIANYSPKGVRKSTVDVFAAHTDGFPRKNNSVSILRFPTMFTPQNNKSLEEKRNTVGVSHSHNISHETFKIKHTVAKNPVRVNSDGIIVENQNILNIDAPKTVPIEENDRIPISVSKFSPQDSHNTSYETFKIKHTAAINPVRVNSDGIIVENQNILNIDAPKTVPIEENDRISISLSKFSPQNANSLGKYDGTASLSQTNNISSPQINNSSQKGFRKSTSQVEVFDTHTDDFPRKNNSVSILRFPTMFTPQNNKSLDEKRNTVGVSHSHNISHETFKIKHTVARNPVRVKSDGIIVEDENILNIDAPKTVPIEENDRIPISVSKFSPQDSYNTSYETFKIKHTAARNPVSVNSDGIIVENENILNIDSPKTVPIEENDRFPISVSKFSPQDSYNTFYETFKIKHTAARNPVSVNSDGIIVENQNILSTNATKTVPIEENDGIPISVSKFSPQDSHNTSYETFKIKHTAARNPVSVNSDGIIENQNILSTNATKTGPIEENDRISISMSKFSPQNANLLGKYDGTDSLSQSHSISSPRTNISSPKGFRKSTSQVDVFDAHTDDFPRKNDSVSILRFPTMFTPQNNKSLEEKLNTVGVSHSHNISHETFEIKHTVSRNPIRVKSDGIIVENENILSIDSPKTVPIEENDRIPISMSKFSPQDSHNTSYETFKIKHTAARNPVSFNSDGIIVENQNILSTNATKTGPIEENDRIPISVSKFSPQDSYNTSYETFKIKHTAARNPVSFNSDGIIVENQNILNINAPKTVPIEENDRISISMSKFSPQNVNLLGKYDGTDSLSQSHSISSPRTNISSPKGFRKSTSQVDVFDAHTDDFPRRNDSVSILHFPTMFTPQNNKSLEEKLNTVGVSHSHETFETKHTVSRNPVRVKSDGIIVENENILNIDSPKTVPIEENDRISISLSKFSPQNANSLGKYDGTASLSQTNNISSPQINNSSQKGFRKSTSQVEVFDTHTDDFPRKNNSVSILRFPTMFTPQNNKSLEEERNTVGVSHSHNISHETFKIKHTVSRNPVRVKSDGIIVENENILNIDAPKTVPIEENDRIPISVSKFSPQDSYNTSYETFKIKHTAARNLVSVNSDGIIVENQNILSTNAPKTVPIEENDRISISLSKFSPQNANSLGKYDGTASLSQTNNISSPQINNSSQKGFRKSTSQVEVFDTHTDDFPRKNNSVSILRFPTMFTPQNNKSLEEERNTVGVSHSHNISHETFKIKHTVSRNPVRVKSDGIIVENENILNIDAPKTVPIEENDRIPISVSKFSPQDSYNTSYETFKIKHTAARNLVSVNSDGIIVENQNILSTNATKTVPIEENDGIPISVSKFSPQDSHNTSYETFKIKHTAARNPVSVNSDGIIVENQNILSTNATKTGPIEENDRISISMSKFSPQNANLLGKYDGTDSLSQSHSISSPRTNISSPKGFRKSTSQVDVFDAHTDDFPRKNDSVSILRFPTMFTPQNNKSLEEKLNTVGVSHSHNISHETFEIKHTVSRNPIRVKSDGIIVENENILSIDSPKTVPIEENDRIPISMSKFSPQDSHNTSYETFKIKHTAARNPVSFNSDGIIVENQNILSTNATKTGPIEENDRIPISVSKFSPQDSYNTSYETFKIKHTAARNPVSFNSDGIIVENQNILNINAPKTVPIEENDRISISMSKFSPQNVNLLGKYDGTDSLSQSHSISSPRTNISSPKGFRKSTSQVDVFDAHTDDFPRRNDSVSILHFPTMFTPQNNKSLEEKLNTVGVSHSHETFETKHTVSRNPVRVKSDGIIVENENILKIDSPKTVPIEENDRISISLSKFSPQNANSLGKYDGTASLSQTNNISSPQINNSSQKGFRKSTSQVEVFDTHTDDFPRKNNSVSILRFPTMFTPQNNKSLEEERNTVGVSHSHNISHETFKIKHTVSRNPVRVKSDGIIVENENILNIDAPKTVPIEENDRIPISVSKFSPQDSYNTSYETFKIKHTAARNLVSVNSDGIIVENQKILSTNATKTGPIEENDRISISMSKFSPQNANLLGKYDGTDSLSQSHSISSLRTNISSPKGFRKSTSQVDVFDAHTDDFPRKNDSVSILHFPTMFTLQNKSLEEKLNTVGVSHSHNISHETFKIKQTVARNPVRVNSDGIIVENQNIVNINAPKTVPIEGKDRISMSVSKFSPQNANLLGKYDGTASLSQSHSIYSPRTNNSSQKGFRKSTSQVDVFDAHINGFPRKNNSVPILHFPAMFAPQNNKSLEEKHNAVGVSHSHNISHEIFKINHTVARNPVRVKSDGIIVENQNILKINAPKNVPIEGKDGISTSVSKFSPQNANLLGKYDGTASLSQSHSISSPRTNNSSQKGFRKSTSQVDIFDAHTDGFPRKNNSVSILHFPAMFAPQNNKFLEEKHNAVGVSHSHNISHEIFKINHTVARNPVRVNSDGIIVENQNTLNINAPKNVPIEGKHRISMSVSKFSPQNANILGKYDGTASLSQSHSIYSPRTNNSSSKGFRKSTSQVDVFAIQTDGFLRKKNSVSMLHFTTTFTPQNNKSLEKNINTMGEFHSQNTSYQTIKNEHTAERNHTYVDSKSAILGNQNNSKIINISSTQTTKTEEMAKKVTTNGLATEEVTLEEKAGEDYFDDMNSEADYENDEYTEVTTFETYIKSNISAHDTHSNLSTRITKTNITTNYTFWKPQREKRSIKSDNDNVRKLQTPSNDPSTEFTENNTIHSGLTATTIIGRTSLKPNISSSNSFSTGNRKFLVSNHQAVIDIPAGYDAIPTDKEARKSAPKQSDFSKSKNRFPFVENNTITNITQKSEMQKIPTKNDIKVGETFAVRVFPEIVKIFQPATSNISHVDESIILGRSALRLSDADEIKSRIDYEEDDDDEESEFDDDDDETSHRKKKHKKKKRKKKKKHHKRGGKSKYKKKRKGISKGSRKRKTSSKRKNENEQQKRRRAQKKHRRRRKKRRRAPMRNAYNLPVYKNIDILTLRPKRIHVLKDWRDQDDSAINLESIDPRLLKRVRGALTWKKLNETLIPIRRKSSTREAVQPITTENIVATTVLGNNNQATEVIEKNIQVTTTGNQAGEGNLPAPESKKQNVHQDETTIRFGDVEKEESEKPSVAQDETTIKLGEERKELEKLSVAQYETTIRLVGEERKESEKPSVAQDETTIRFGGEERKVSEKPSVAQDETTIRLGGEERQATEEETFSTQVAKKRNVVEENTESAITTLVEAMGTGGAEEINKRSFNVKNKIEANGNNIKRHTLSGELRKHTSRRVKINVKKKVKKKQAAPKEGQRKEKKDVNKQKK